MQDVAGPGWADLSGLLLQAFGASGSRSSSRSGGEQWGSLEEAVLLHALCCRRCAACVCVVCVCVSGGSITCRVALCIARLRHVLCCRRGLWWAGASCGCVYGTPRVLIVL